MKRLLFNILAGLSALLCLLLLAIPITHLLRISQPSFFMPRGLQFSSEDYRLTIAKWEPETSQWWRERPDNRPMQVTASKSFIVQDARGGKIYGAQIYVRWTTGTWGGFEWRAGAVSQTQTGPMVGAMSTPMSPYRSLSMPWFYPLPLLLILPALFVRRALRLRHRRVLGLCPACGYDLRASPDRCPECGSAIVSNKL